MENKGILQPATSEIILRLVVSVILCFHAIPGMFNGGIYDFGTQYLDQVGFAPFGLVLAWSVKLSHLVNVLALLLNRWVRISSLVTILVLIVGIFMVHLPNGWFVVGGGFNGIEFNVLLIAVLLHFVFSEKVK